MIATLLLASLLATGAPTDLVNAPDDPDLTEMKKLSVDELRAMLQGLLKERKGASSVTKQRVTAFRALGASDERAAGWMARFPATLAVDVEGAGKMEAAAVRTAMTRVFREVGLPFADTTTPASSTLRIRVRFEPMDMTESVLANTGMKSFAAISTGALVEGGADADGARLLSFATAPLMLGISVGYAAQSGVDRLAGQLCDALMRAVAASLFGGVPDSTESRAAKITPILAAAKETVRMLQERAATGPAARAAVAALPLALSFAPAPGVDGAIAVVLQDEVRRLLREAGVPVVEPGDEAAVGTLRILYDAQSTGGKMMTGYTLRAALRAEGPDGTLFTRSALTSYIELDNPRAALVRNLTYVAACMVQAVAEGLASVADAPALLPDQLAALEGRVPFTLVPFGSGTGDIVADQLLAATVADELAQSLRVAGIATSPRPRSKGRLVARAARDETGGFTVDLWLQVADRAPVEARGVVGPSKWGEAVALHEAVEAATKQLVAALVRDVGAQDAAAAAKAP